MSLCVKNKRRITLENDRLAKALEMISGFATGSVDLSSISAFQMVREIILPLLEADGYAGFLPRSYEDGIELIAGREVSDFEAELSIAIAFEKSEKQHLVSIPSIDLLLGACNREGVDRAMLVTTSRFSDEVRDIVARDLPVTFELVDINALKAWAGRIGRSFDANEKAIVDAVRDFAKQLARLIAQNPNYLWNIEWRDMERLLAEIFKNLGFDVELTPSSKDGGKDIVLECVISGSRHRYIIEVKHWISQKKVGSEYIKDFIHVVVRENRSGGLFLSTSGYTDDTFQVLGEIERQRVRLGGKEKVIGLCRTFARAESGLWSPPELLPELLFEDTKGARHPQLSILTE